MITLRPYQAEAIRAVEEGWQEHRRQLLVLPTGGGKTICFATIAQHRAEMGQNVLILAHRDELIDQARDKYRNVTGGEAAKEKAAETSIGSGLPVVVGSVQTMCRASRLDRFPHDHFSTIIVDEAHHCPSASYRSVLDWFPDADLLGVTATPDRADRKSLATCFDAIAYEYSLRDAINDGYLCRIQAQMIPLAIDMSNVKISVGDYEVSSVADAIDPYLEEIAQKIKEHASDRKTIVFLPLVATSQRFCGILQGIGMDAREVNGESADRKEVLEWFDKAGPGSVLCNAMLLTEGYDCPSVDCIVMLRPTKSRALYTQCIGRGTRIHPGKENLLLLDFLWLSQRHNLCRPASLFASTEEDEAAIVEKMTKDREAIDLMGAASDAEDSRMKSLAEQLKANAKKKGKLIDPLDWAVSISAADLADYEPAFPWEFDPISDKQRKVLEDNGFDTFGMTKGYASQILDRLFDRSRLGLASPKQIKALEKRGYREVGRWPKKLASSMIETWAKAEWKPWRVRTDMRPEVFDWTRCS